MAQFVHKICNQKSTVCIIYFTNPSGYSPLILKKIGKCEKNAGANEARKEGTLKTRIGEEYYMCENSA